METIVDEIKAHLLHKDFDLAKRRLLDAVYQNGDTALMQRTLERTTAINTENQFAELPNLVENTIKDLQLKRIENNTTLVNATTLHKKYNKGLFTLQTNEPVQINSGDIIGVVGENGNGKTTLLRSLAGQLAITTGQINYSLLKSDNYYDIKNYVVFIPQRINRWFGLLKDNLHFSAALAGFKGTTNEVMVAFIMERMGLTKYANYTWNTISSGYRTRFEIARILLQKPQLLILDEPLANLDINAQQTLLNDLKFIVKSWNDPLAIILSSQQLHEVEKIADKVIFIKNGRCVLNPIGSEAKTNTVVELEIENGRAALVTILPEYSVHFNGGLYTITSQKPDDVTAILTTLLQHKITLKYFRDITYSTKKLFN
jgi:ABC-2 type transport system ATP-binding protein